jgi:hypothetical protein
MSDHGSAIPHESEHGCGGAAMVLLRCVKHGLSVNATYKSVELYLARGDHDEDVIAECGFNIEHDGLRHDVLAGAALAPAICSSEDAVNNAIKTSDLSRLFTSELSDVDIAVFKQYGSTVDQDDVLLAGLAAKEFHKRLAHNAPAFYEKLAEAMRRHDSLLPLHRIYPVDIVRGCIDSVRPAFKHQCKRLRHPAQCEDERLERRWKAKQKNYTAADEAEKQTRRRMGIA